MRLKNVQIAKDILEIIKSKSYTPVNSNKVDISSDIDYSVKNSKFIEEFNFNDTYPIYKTKIEVVNQKATNVGFDLLEEYGDVAVLNFAAARNPGGGFLSGSTAQEEELCRDSMLYACIKNKPMYYNKNILCDDSYYTEGMIYSPQVPFIRKDNVFVDMFKLSVITSPAPNLNAISEIDDDKLEEVLNTRISNILKVAINNNHKALVLGAWGCGAFGNDSYQVASIFKEHLKNNPGFSKVVFAVFDAKTPATTYKTFKEVFEK